MEEQKFEAKSLKHLKNLLENRRLSNGQALLRSGEFKKAMVYIDAAQESVNSFMTPFKERVAEIREGYENQIESLETKVQMLEVALEVNNAERRRATANLMHAFALDTAAPGTENPTVIEVAITLVIAMERMAQVEPSFRIKFIDLLRHYIPHAKEEAQKYL